MPDLREVLDRSAPEISTLDAGLVRRRAVRRRLAPRALAAVCALVVVGAGVVVATGGDGSPRRVESGSTPTSIAPPTSTTTTAPTTTTVPSTTSSPPPTLPIGEDRLSIDSRLGYAGLGPIKLGMDFDAAVAAAHVTVQPDPTCDTALYGEPGSGVESISVWGRPIIDTITVWKPGILTIAGVGVGSTRSEMMATYPSAAEEDGSLVITGPEGHAIIFAFEGDSLVTMTLTADRQVLERHNLC